MHVHAVILWYETGVFPWSSGGQVRGKDVVFTAMQSGLYMRLPVQPLVHGLTAATYGLGRLGDRLTTGEEVNNRLVLRAQGPVYGVRFCRLL